MLSTQSITVAISSIPSKTCPIMCRQFRIPRASHSQRDYIASLPLNAPEKTPRVAPWPRAHPKTRGGLPLRILHSTLHQSVQLTHNYSPTPITWCTKDQFSSEVTRSSSMSSGTQVQARSLSNPKPALIALELYSIIPHQLLMSLTIPLHMIESVILMEHLFMVNLEQTKLAPSLAKLAPAQTLFSSWLSLTLVDLLILMVS